MLIHALARGKNAYKLWAAGIWLAAVVQSQYLDFPKKKRLAGSLVYDTGFPFQQESAGNPGSNPGGRTMFQLKLLGRIATHPIAPDKDVSSDLG